jgi:hypothetical protein
VHDAIERGYLVNRSERPNQYDLDVGDPLAATEELLPSHEELDVMCREAGVFGPRSASVRPPTEHAIPVVQPKNDECSVCSVDSGEGGSDPVDSGVESDAVVELFKGIGAVSRSEWTAQLRAKRYGEGA